MKKQVKTLTYYENRFMLNNLQRAQCSLFISSQHVSDNGIIAPFTLLWKAFSLKSILGYASILSEAVVRFN